MLGYLRYLLGQEALAAVATPAEPRPPGSERGNTGPGRSETIDRVPIGAADMPYNETEPCGLPILPEMRPFGSWSWQ